jgi:uncharacterized membrane protein (Fun14 family)
LTIDSYLFSAAGGFALGAIAGYAFKRIMKLAAIVVGLFVMGLAYLSYKGWINVNWPIVQNQTLSGIHNATQQAATYVQSAANQMATHPAILQGQGMTIAAGLMFVPGFVWGVRH